VNGKPSLRSGTCIDTIDEAVDRLATSNSAAQRIIPSTARAITDVILARG
jgi:hypothetical protein